MFHRCCLIISFLEIFGNLSLYSKLIAITLIAELIAEHSREHRTEYSDLETTGCIKEGNELFYGVPRFSAQQKSGAEARLNVCTIFHYEINLDQKVFNSFSN